MPVRRTTRQGQIRTPRRTSIVPASYTRRSGGGRRRGCRRGCLLAARGESPAAFERCCMPPDCVVSRSNTAGILPRHALSSGRITALGATRDFHHGLLGRDAVCPGSAVTTHMSERSGMSIVASAGYYVDEMYPSEIATMSEDQIAQELIRDATVNPVGAFGEIGTSDEITPNERKVFRAVRKAHLATNLPIYTHTANGTCAEEQLDILESIGVKPERVTIGHLGSMVAPEVEVHKAICKRGAFVGFDRQGGRSDDRNVPMVLKLLDAGYADQLLFSADFGGNAWPNWQQRWPRSFQGPDRVRAQAASGRRQRGDAARYPGKQFTSVPRVCSKDS